MNWYYAPNNEQLGPIDQAGLDRLVQQGTITPETLVWHEGLTDWQPLAQALPAANAPAAGGILCSECRRTFPVDQVVKLGGGHVCADCKPIALQKLQPEDLDTLYAQLLSDGKRNGTGGGLAPKTVRIIHGIIRKALADAHRKGTVNRNVADLADPPKVRLGGRTAMKVWSAEELRTFLASIEYHDLYTAFFLVANTGMRRGEVLGLTWRNVDLDTARLVVSQCRCCPWTTRRASPT